MPTITRDRLRKGTSSRDSIFGSDRPAKGSGRGRRSLDGLFSRLSDPQFARVTTGPSREARPFLGIVAIVALLVGALVLLAGTGQFSGDSALRGADTWVTGTADGVTNVVHLFAGDAEGSLAIPLSNLSGGDDLAGTRVGVVGDDAVMLSVDAPSQVARIDPSGGDVERLILARQFPAADAVQVAGNDQSVGIFIVTESGTSGWRVRLVDAADPDEPPPGAKETARQLDTLTFDGPLRFVVLGDGSFWFYDTAKGSVRSVDGSGLSNTTPIAEPGTPVHLFGIDGVPVALVLDSSPHLRFLGGPREGDEAALPESAGSAKRIAPPAGDIPGDSVWVADRASRRITGIPINGGRSIVRRIPSGTGPVGGTAAQATGASFASVHPLGDFVYVVDLALPGVWQVPKQGGAPAPITVAAPGGTIDAVERDGYLWVDDPTGDSLVVIDADGVPRTITKIGANTTKLDPEELKEEIVSVKNPAKPTPVEVVIEQEPGENEGTKSEDPTAPTSPRNVSAAPGSQFQLVVSCSPPLNDGGARVTEYEITIAGPGEASASQDECSMTFDGLAEGSWTASVAACNSVGCSPTASSAAATVAGPGAGNAPENIEVSGVDNELSYTVSWTHTPAGLGPVSFSVDAPGGGCGTTSPATCSPGVATEISASDVSVTANEEGFTPAKGSGQGGSRIRVAGAPVCAPATSTNGTTWDVTLSGPDGVWVGGNQGNCAGGPKGLICANDLSKAATFSNSVGKSWTATVSSPCPPAPPTTTTTAPPPTTTAPPTTTTTTTVATVTQIAGSATSDPAALALAPMMVLVPGAIGVTSLGSLALGRTRRRRNR